MKTYDLVSAADIPTHLVNDISHARHRVHLQTMDFGTTGKMRPVTDAVHTALKRGVSVTLAFDKLSFLGMVTPEVRQLRKDCATLEAEGAKIVLLGKSLLPLPVAGRSHTKLYIIDDIAYFGGGVNLYDKAFAAHDFMLRMICDDMLADSLDQVVERQPNEWSDWQIELDGSEIVLVDGGGRTKSIILEEATKLAATAHEAWYVSQYSPGRKLEAELVKLSNGDIKAWFNTPQSSESYDKLSAFIDMKLTKVPNSYKGTQRIHAKFLVVQGLDGNYAAVTGSHNFSDWGVRFGTKEAALYTTDQALCKQLIKFAESLDA